MSIPTGRWMTHRLTSAVRSMWTSGVTTPSSASSATTWSRRMRGAARVSLLLPDAHSGSPASRSGSVPPGRRGTGALLPACPQAPGSVLNAMARGCAYHGHGLCCAARAFMAAGDGAGEVRATWAIRGMMHATVCFWLPCRSDVRATVAARGVLHGDGAVGATVTCPLATARGAPDGIALPSAVTAAGRAALGTRRGKDLDRSLQRVLRAAVPGEGSGTAGALPCTRAPWLRITARHLRCTFDQTRTLPVYCAVVCDDRGGEVEAFGREEGAHA